MTLFQVKDFYHDDYRPVHYKGYKVGLGHMKVDYFHSYKRYFVFKVTKASSKERESNMVSIHKRLIIHVCTFMDIIIVFSDNS